MLSTLSVQNFAIIDNINVQFKPGLTILTGETGAGKSLIIDAIGLLLGERSSPSMIRSGFPKAIIEGIFIDYNDRVKELLAEYGIEEIDSELIIKKEILTSGKSTARINGTLVTVTQLSEIAKQLADIHSQEDTRLLFQPSNYLDFIESPSSRKELINYQNALQDYAKKLERYQNLKKRADEDESQMEFLRYRYEELEKANLKIEEEEEIEQEIRILNNYEQIYKNLSLIKDSFEQNNIVNTLYQTKQMIGKLAELNPEYEASLKKCENLYYELADLESEIIHNANHLEFDENRLNLLNERSSFLYDLKRKFRKSIPELINYQKELKDHISEFESIDDLIEDARVDVEDAFQLLKEHANNLTSIRKANAKELQEDIRVTLAELHLAKVQIEIKFLNPNLNDPFDVSAFKEKGIDQIDIFISFNPGEPLKELSKVASGGEMSRVMLALKTHLLSNLHLSTMIFDEIDQGVSGAVAEAIAFKMKKISQMTQVLAITHLPIVASSADQHYLIKKEVQEGRTFTYLQELTLAERVDEIAKMIAPSAQDEQVKNLALSMMKQWS